ncbi:MAG: TIGR04182 family glycosyltransferase, partial [Halobacteria archaeon]|nr:TIGR04182 family glycosyltransferase [Halobacteria archaeon]
PITYRARPEDSDTKLNPVRDGARIGYTIYRMTKTNNPFFYFGSVGALLLVGGVASGGYVVYDWYFNNISHEVIAILTALLVISGTQLFIFASLSDVLFELHRDEMRQIYDVLDELEDGDGDEEGD